MVTVVMDWETPTIITTRPKMKEKEPKHKTHNLQIQESLHSKIRNDEDYDDWEYGTEPTYGVPINTDK